MLSTGNCFDCLSCPTSAPSRQNNRFRFVAFSESRTGIRFGGKLSSHGAPAPFGEAKNRVGPSGRFRFAYRAPPRSLETMFPVGASPSANMIGRLLPVARFRSEWSHSLDK
jgi:hypothetical protein